MNPIILDIGPLELHAYTAWIVAGVLAGLGIMAWCARQQSPGSMLRWVDVSIAGIAGGVIGARLLHVAQEWAYFADHTDQIRMLSLGGMAWHGALVGGVPAVLGMAWLRGLSWRDLRAWTDALALAWPVGMIAAWLACRRNGCAYGYEVRTLADWPGWQVEELPDIYGLSAPRLDIQLAGVAFGAALLILALLLTWRGWLPGLRLWVILALSGLGLALIAFFRADPAHLILDHRADQVYDLGVLLVSTITGGMLWLADRREQHALADKEERERQRAEKDRIHMEKLV